MKTFIRRAVFETNSSSSHSLTMGPGDLRDMTLARDALEAGEMIVNIDDHFGWEWKRLYRPENKIAYLLSQFSSKDLDTADLGQDIAKRLKRRCSSAETILSAVEEATGLTVKVQVNTDYPGVDHESHGLGSGLLQDRDKLLDFIFSPQAYVQLGNDNNKPPALIETDLGKRVDMFPEHFIQKPFKGLKVDIEAQRYGKTANVTINRDKETHVLSERFCAAHGLRGMLKGFDVGDARITLYKPRKFNSLRIIDGEFSDGSGLWNEHGYLVETARDKLHELIHAISDEPGDIRIPRDLEIKVKVEKTDTDSYLTPEPKISLTGVMRPKDLDHLKSSLLEYANEKRQHEEDMRP